MSFFETPTRRLHVVRAFGSLVLAIAIGALSLMPDVDYFGRIFCLSLAAFCALMVALNLWRARRAPSLATVTPIPDRAPILAQVRLFRQMLWISIIAFPVMTAWVAYDLKQLEVGNAKHAEIWAPLVPIYHYLGYWPTVGSLAGLGVACCAVFVYKIRKLTPKSVL
jgi:hypothetical protein